MTTDNTLLFAGVDDRADAALPEWFTSRRLDAPVVSFAEAIRRLPRAVETTVAYSNPYTDEWVPTERFSALVDPERLEQQARDDAETDPLFYVPTSTYSVINPVDVYAPLEDVLREHTVDEQLLGDVVFGEIRQYRGGGEVHMDILFDGLSVDLPGRRAPITMGVSSGYDFFGGRAVYIEGHAQDTYCSNSIRQLTERESVKHVGEIADFRTWWERLLTRLELVSDDLMTFILDAQEITLDLTAVPFDLVDFYSLLEFPDYLAQRAASDARAEAPDPLNVDMWTLHSGATYALTHFYTGREGAALDGYVRTANDILFNPRGTLSRLTRAYERRASAATSTEGQTELSSQSALVQLERVAEDVASKADRFEAREAVLRERFAATE